MPYSITVPWVLVKVPTSPPHKAAQGVSRWWIGEALSIGACQVITRQDSPSTIMGNIFEEYHAPYTSKKSFVDLNIK